MCVFSLGPSAWAGFSYVWHLCHAEFSILSLAHISVHWLMKDFLPGMSSALFSETWVQAAQSCTDKSNIHKQCQVLFTSAQVSRLPWALGIVSSLCLHSMSRKTFGWVALIVEQLCCSFFMKKVFEMDFSFYTLAFSVDGILPSGCFSYCPVVDSTVSPYWCYFYSLKITDAFLNFNLFIFHFDHSLPSLPSPFLYSH